MSVVSATDNIAVAQDTASTVSPDSLAARLARAEAAIELLRQQLGAQAGSQVQSRSRSALEFSGKVVLNAFGNSGRSNNYDVPQIAVPNAAGAGYQSKSAGGSVRQTILSLSAQGARVLGADASAFIEGDFSGGVQAGGDGRKLFPEPRLRIARGTLRWAHGELMVGQDVPLVAPEEPVSTASLQTPLFALAGNLWFWIPQVRATYEWAGPVRWAVQGALLAPWSGGDVVAGDGDAADIGERQRLPMVEIRLRARWGEDEMAGEVGLGVHQGWLGSAADTSISSQAVAITWHVPLRPWLELRGEAYRGQVLRGLGGGGVGQNFGVNAALQPIPLHDAGGWMQVNARPNPTWSVGAGCGMSHPDEGDRPTRLKNDVCELHTAWRPGGLPFVGLEYREIQTTYSGGVGLLRTRQVNLAVGVEF